MFPTGVGTVMGGTPPPGSPMVPRFPWGGDGELLHLTLSCCVALLPLAACYACNAMLLFSPFHLPMLLQSPNVSQVLPTKTVQHRRMTTLLSCTVLT